jgi:putative DNA primase/helicase
MFTLYSSDIIGNPGNCSYPNKNTITDATSLQLAVCHDYVCAEYKNNYRNGDNFLGADCLPVDCDNDHSENPADWVLPADVADAFPASASRSTTAATTCGRKTASPLGQSFISCFPSNT